MQNKPHRFIRQVIGSKFFRLRASSSLPERGQTTGRKGILKLALLRSEFNPRSAERFSAPIPAFGRPKTRTVRRRKFSL
jgi:hypothetical protein